MQDESANRSRSISRGLSSLTIQNVITSALAFVFLASLLRLAPVNGYTAYSSVLVSVGIAVTVSTFSLQYAASRYVALCLAKDESKAWAAARATLVLSLIFSAVAVLVFEVLSPALYFMKRVMPSLRLQYKTTGHQLRGIYSEDCRRRLRVPPHRFICFTFAKHLMNNYPKDEL